jgi:hypothetical protein
MAKIIKTDGSVKYVKPKNLVHFTIDELRKHVAANIQIVETSNDKLLVINEEGKLFNLPHNEKATKLYKYNTYDYIVGDALVIDKNQIR